MKWMKCNTVQLYAYYAYYAIQLLSIAMLNKCFTKNTWEEENDMAEKKS
jgi:hypothetical protein